MRRAASWVFGCVVLASVTAAAEPARVAAAEKAVRANIAAAFSGHGALDKTITDTVASGATFHPLIDDNATPWFDGKDKDGAYNNDVVMIWGRDPTVMSLKIAPFKPQIVLDDAANVAWFTAELKVTAVLRTGERHLHDDKGTWPVRVTGILVDDKGWKVAAEKFSLSVSDAKLVKQHDWIPNYGTIDGKAEREIAAWFPEQLAANQSARASDANGTARAEVARAKAPIAKLVAGWDKLAWTPRYVQFTELAGGKIAWAHVELTLPVRDGEKRMSVGVVAVPEAGRWKWVSLNWSPEVYFTDADH